MQNGVGKFRGRTEIGFRKFHLWIQG